MKLYVVYQFNWLGCYIGKTEDKLCTRTAEHAFIDKESAVYSHINNRTHHGCIRNLFHFNYDSFNPFLAYFAILCPLKTPENLKVFCCLRWVENWNIGQKLVNKTLILIRSKATL